MIDKTLSTFPTASTLLAQMYRTMRFRTYSELTTFLLLAEKQQQLLLKNNESKPPWEVNAMKIPTRRPKGSWKQNQHKPPQPYHKPKDKHSNQTSGSRPSNQSKSDDRKCHKCGRTGHLQKDCRTGECKKCGRPGHLARDCQTSTCHRCGRSGHMSQECRAGEYVEKMYKELQELHKGQWESHSLDAPSLSPDTENYMTIVEATPIVMSTTSEHETWPCWIVDQRIRSCEISVTSSSRNLNPNWMTPLGGAPVN